MATDKRARQRANRAKKIEQETRIERNTRIRNLVITGVVVIIGLGGLIYLLSLTGDDDDLAVTPTETEVTLESTTTTTELEIPAVSAPEPGGTLTGTPDCPAEDGSSDRITQFDQAPPTCIDQSATYIAEIDTTLGSITVELDAAAAPETVNNFVFLARYHYYDGAPFHRIIPGFVIQGGDATGDPLGTGNPGYLINEEPPEQGAYEVGSLAMAKGPGDQSTGSQFFFVTGPQGTALPNQYSLFGQVSEGLDVVQAIEAIPTTSGDYPTEEIYIESVTITEG